MIEFSKRELDIIGMTEDSPDEINRMMRESILNIILVFSNSGFSGFSASYAVNVLEKLLRFDPLTPLTGEDDEWVDVSGYGDGTPHYQNKRASRVFKDADGSAYDIDGKVFWDWYTDPETGVKSKSHFTCRESRVAVEFPYTPTTVYEERIE